MRLTRSGNQGEVLCNERKLGQVAGDSIGLLIMEIREPKKILSKTHLLRVAEKRMSRELGRMTE